MYRKWLTKIRQCYITLELIIISNTTIPIRTLHTQNYTGNNNSFPMVYHIFRLKRRGINDYCDANLSMHLLQLYLLVQMSQHLQPLLTSEWQKFSNSSKKQSLRHNCVINVINNL